MGTSWEDLSQFGHIDKAIEFFKTDAIVERLTDGIPEHITAYKVRGVEGNVLLAQRTDGSGPVRWMPTPGRATAREIRRARKRGSTVRSIGPPQPRKRTVGGWVKTPEYTCEADIIDSWCHNARPSEYKVVKYLWLVAYHIGEDIYEYAQLPSGEIIARVLHRPGR